MSTKIVNSIKYIGLFTLVLFSIIACEKDFENVGVGLVDNNLFTPDVETFEVVAYNENLSKNRVDGIPRHLLGVYNHSDFGLLKSSFIGQLNLAEIKFSDNMSIDAVVLDIPYFATKLIDNTFELDSIIGDQTKEFNLSVYELGTFLNTLDPADPTKNKKYYSNKIDYIKKALLYTGDFKPNKSDTLLYVERRFLDGDINTVDDKDTIKKEKSFPSIKIHLDTVFFRNNFINQQNSGAFDSSDNFKDHFRGLVIDADGTDGAMMQLAMSNATVTMYYSNIVLTDETTATGDLNGDGDTDDKEVPVKTKQTTAFPLSGVSTSQYSRDYTTSNVNILERFNNPDEINGEDKLYIQGAAGSITILDLFKNIDLNVIRDNNWLINEANLTLYVDNPSDTIIPNKLYLYKYDYNSQILDATTEGFIDGILKKGEDNKPLKYEFLITDYISEVLKNDSEVLSTNKLAIKAFNSRDTPITANDTLMRDYSWDAKGVVLKGNKILDSHEDYAKRLKLEIFYTKGN